MAPRSLVSVCLPLLGCIQSAFASALASDGQVHVLTEANFEASVRKFPFTFVEFYAPWCGHCKTLEPEWVKTAELAQAYDVPVAKVDAIAEEKLAAKYNVQSFPTLSLYKGDPEIAVTYKGPRDGASMAEWLRKWTQAKPLARPHPTEAALKAWTPDAKLKLVGLLSGQAEVDKSLEELLEAAAFALNPSGPSSEVPVALVPLPGGEIAKLGVSGVTLPCVALLRDFDFEAKTVIYEDHAEGLQPFLKWLSLKKAPALIPASRETQDLFLTDAQPGNAVALLFGFKSSEDPVREVRKLAVEMSPMISNLQWVHVEQNDFGESLAKNVQLEASDFPEFVIWQFGEQEDDDLRFKLSQHADHSGSFPMQDLAQSVRRFVENWQAGALSPSTGGSTGAAKKVVPPPAEKKKAKAKPASGKKGNDKPKEVQCPMDADIFACSKWCEDSSADGFPLIGTLGGKPCEEWSPKDKLHDRTTCTCYDQDFTEVKLSCNPECVKAKDNFIDADTTRSINSATCAAGDSSCMAESTMTTTPVIDDDDEDIAADF